MRVKQLDERIVQLLNKRGYNSKKEIDDFLSPSLSMLRDPFKLKGMREAKQRIEKAIKDKEKIVVYGDYDCDGISACVILYKYLSKCGVRPDVYIPDRFDDGYGLSFDMIDEVINNSKPNLIITVDLGITAIDEVEKVKSAGVDIIITDHHEPLQQLPNCIVIDPKIEGQEYGFDGLCGAGVALKLVEALSSRREAEKYFDVCAVATIGDIVPLTDENRLIAKWGINMINQGRCLKSYKYMLSQLGLKNLSGQDVTFKIVPRINASGRMSKGKKVFDFLIQDDDKKLSELFEAMAQDNEERLNSISEGALALEKEVNNVDFQKDNIILLKGDFHQGVLGILASRICHDYERPAIVFTKTESGTLKGSGRSLDGVDLHDALEKCADILIRFGGHKMAIGVELEEKNFDQLRTRLSKNIGTQASLKTFVTQEEYDIQIEEKDISEEFINQLELLEPFGCKNEKPVLMMQSGSLKVSQMKDNSFRHFKITTKTNKSMVGFSADKHIDVLRSNVKKDLIIDLENNYFRGKFYPQAILKNVYVKEISLKEDRERETMVSLINRFFSEGVKNSVEYFEPSELEPLLKRLFACPFGTLVVVDSKKEAERIKNFTKLNNYSLSHVPLKNRQNTILISSRGVLTNRDTIGYNNVVFTRQIFSHEKEYFANDSRVYVIKNKSNFDYRLDKSRQTNVYCYGLLKKYAPLIRANNIFEWLEKLKTSEGGVDKIQMLFSMLSFMELGFVKINFDEFSVELVENPPKRELSSSKFMNKLVG